MKWRFLLAACFTAALTQAVAQQVRVYSEFARIDAMGNVTVPEMPREILSPAIVRNGYTSFQLVIQAPAQTRFLLHMGQNPENALQVTLYRLNGMQLEHVDLPYESSGTEVLWLDLFADHNAAVRRVKVEPQAYINGDWLLYPMEVRVGAPQVPDVLPPATLRTLLCGGVSAAGIQAGAAVAQMHLRNERQDAALATQATPADRDELKKRLGGCSARPSADPEAYLKVRDFFFSPLWMSVRN